MRPSFFAVVVVACVALAAAAGRAEPLTKVYINGIPTPVFFNDGDSFRVFAGPFKGAQARLANYNTLESFGPAHRWGDWTGHELYVLAKLATKTARKGVWHCEGDGKKDGYGRLLLFCKDLASALIQQGLAHAYSVDKNPGDPDLLKVQREAMTKRVGMWAHGVPRYVMTSVHSKAEGGDKNGVTSNRLISTTDAHSEKMEHNDNYEECEWVCKKVPTMNDTDAKALAAKMGELPEAKAVIDAMAPGDLLATLRVLQDVLARKNSVELADLALYGERLPKTVSTTQLDTLIAGVNRFKGDVTTSAEEEDSCFLYVDFKRRYGGERAACLRQH